MKIRRNFISDLKGKSHMYLDFVMGATIIAKREVFEHVKLAKQTLERIQNFYENAIKTDLKYILQIHLIGYM